MKGKQSLISFIMNRPKTIWFLIVLCSVLSIFGISTIQSDFSHRVWFQKNDPYLKIYNQFERDFGNEDYISIVVHNEKGIFNNQTLNIIKDINDDLQNATGIIKVDSLMTFNMIQGKDDDIIIEPLLEDTNQKINLSSDELNYLRDRASESRLIQKYLINQDTTVSVLYGRIKPVFNGKSDYKTIHNEVQNIVKKYELRANGSGVKFHILGTVAIIETLKNSINSDILIIIPSLLLIMLIVMQILYKNIALTFLPLVVITSTLFITTGVASLFGLTYNPITSMIPHILIAICTADTIHILSTYTIFLSRGYEKREALEKTLHKNFVPTVLTSITTTFGFFGLLFTDILPVKQLGAFAGIGTMVAWAMTYLLLPQLILKIKTDGSKYIKKKSDQNNHFQTIRKYISFLGNWKSLIILPLIIVCFISYQNNKENTVDSKSVNMLKKGTPLRNADIFMAKKFGGANGIELVIKARDGKTITDPTFLKDLESLLQWIRGQKNIHHVISLNSIIKEINYVLNNQDPKHLSIPDNNKSIAEQLFLYELSANDITQWKKMNDKKLRASIIWSANGSKEADEIINRIEAKAASMNLDVKAAGKTALLKGVNTYLVKVFFQSMLVAVIFIAFIMLIFLKSPTLAALSLLPNVIPPLIGMGAMKYFGIHIDFGTVLVASVCLGIAIDDTIHFLYNYKKQFDLTKDSNLALSNVLLTTGPALVSTTIILILSFFTFTLGDVSLNTNFGMLTMFILLIALLCDVVILPCLLANPSKEESLAIEKGYSLN
ncbi:MAG: MMPL family transporter [Bacteriovoracaceae bacterium]|nr:MMPL family transporter [Bacteriovoracaceae bacterium]